MYAFLEKVFNQTLYHKGYRITWVMLSTDKPETKTTKWGNNTVILIPKYNPQSIVDLLLKYKLHFNNITRVAREAINNYGPFDLIQVRDDPAMAYVGWRLARSLDIPFVYQVSHLKEEELILYAKMGIYGSKIKNLLMGEVALLLRNYILRKSDLVFPISERMKKTLEDYGVTIQRLVPIPEGVDATIQPSDFDKAATTLARRLGLENKDIILYIGTINRFRQLDFLFPVMRRVLRKKPKAHLLIVGPGRQAGDSIWLENRASEEGVRGNVTFIGRVPREQIPAYIRMASVGVSPFPPNKVLINNSPIKILEYMAMGIPVVATDIPEQRSILRASGAGLCVPWDQEMFANAISEILYMPSRLKSLMGERGRRWVLENRSFDILAEKVAREYIKLLTNSK